MNGSTRQPRAGLMFEPILDDGRTDDVGPDVWIDWVVDRHVAWMSM